MAITPSKPGIFLSQPVSRNIPTNPTPCRTHWNTASGKFFVCGTGRQPILRNKMENDNYYLLTLAAIAKEIKQRSGRTECSVNIAAGLPLAGFGREKKPFREYFLRSSQLAGGCALNSSQEIGHKVYCFIASRITSIHPIFFDRL